MGKMVRCRAIMRRRIAILVLLLNLLFCSLPVRNCSAQSTKVSSGDPPSYVLRVPVNEISLTFHASDANGAPLNHLMPRDVRVWDNGKLQNNIVMLEAFRTFRSTPVFYSIRAHR